MDNPTAHMDGLDMDLAHAAKEIERLEENLNALMIAAVKVNALSIQTDAHRELRGAIAMVRKNVSPNAGIERPQPERF